MKPVLESFRRDYDYCTFCPKLCRFACPVASAELREAVTPWAKMSSAGMLLRSGRPSETVYHCLNCLLCNRFCEHGIDVPRALNAARAVICAERAAPERAAGILETFSAGRGLDGSSLSQRLHAVLDEKYFLKEARVIFFAGCVASSFFPADVMDAIVSFEKLGVDWVAAWDAAPFCCGMPLYNMGLMDEFERNARELAAALSQYRTVISGCPACVYVLRVLYPESGFALKGRIVHVSEFLLPLLQEPRRSDEGANAPYAYHDPCYLSRHLSITSEPRNVLTRLLGRSPVELRWSAAESYCCGGGGAVALVLPEVAEGVARSRAAHVKESGAAFVVTACPSCKRMLSKARDGFEVKDIANVAIETLKQQS